MNTAASGRKEDFSVCHEFMADIADLAFRHAQPARQGTAPHVPARPRCQREFTQDGTSELPAAGRSLLACRRRE